jgi:hypothetical protein
MRSGLIFLAQIAGGICAAAVVSCLFPGPLSVETTLGGGTSISQGLFIEMFLTAQLVFVIIMLAVVKHRSTYLAPVGIGLTFFLTELCGMFAPYLSGSCVSLKHRYLLHRWFSQFRSVPRPCSCQPPLPRILLDLLRGTPSRITPSNWILLAAQPPALPNLQPRPRLR